MTDRNALADKIKIFVEEQEGYLAKVGSLPDAIGYALAEIVFENRAMIDAALRQSPSDASPRAPTQPVTWTRDQLGRFVREAWIRWARTQPNPKPSWLVPYDFLLEPDKEADRQIGEAIVELTAQPAPAAAPLGREALARAYEAGALAVHQAWVDTSHFGEGPPRGDPEFSEAAHDYADSVLPPPGEQTVDYWKVSWREPNKEHNFKILQSKALALEWANRISAEHGIHIEHVDEAIEPEAPQ